MIKYKNTTVRMEFDSGIFKHIHICNPKLHYPNKLTKEQIDSIETTISVVMETILNEKKDD